MKKDEIKKIYAELKNFADKSVTLYGWVRSVRASKDFGFIDMTDGTCFKTAQIVFAKGGDFDFDAVSKLTTGSTIKVEGSVFLTPENKQPFEIKATNVEILSRTDETYPLQKKRHTVEFLRQIAYLRPRTNLFSAIYRVRSEAAFAFHDFFHKNGFVYVHTPILTSSDCEGGSDLFRVTTHNFYAGGEPIKPEDDYFGKPVYLTPTGQLEGEAMASAFTKIYTFGPTFRSENSNTTRHASEFWMIEPEVYFADLEDIMDLEEAVIKYVIRHIFDTCPDEMNMFNSFVDTGLIDRLNNVLNSEFARVTYTDAIEILKKNNDKFEYKVEWGSDIQTEHERYLAETVYKRPVFVTDYPKEIKAFYMKQNPDGKTVRACDLLAPGVGEITGGSQREEDYDKLVARMHELGLKEKDYDWYLNLRKFGTATHSGFGIGFERILMYITGVSNIRDVALFARTPKNCEF